MNNLLVKLFTFILVGALLGIFVPFQWNAEINDTEENWSKMQKLRRDSLAFICLNKTRSGLEKKISNDVTSRLYVNENHKFIYCEVPKVGCSNWKKIILLLTLNMSRDVFEVNHDYIHLTGFLKRLSSYPSEQQTQLLTTFTKVMFTRHPLERLVSAYKDKLLHSEPYYITVANEIKALLRKNKTITGEVTFQEFVSFILSKNSQYLDIHWKPMYQLCDPCNIQYDILGKYETLQQDASQVLSRIGAPKNIHYPSSEDYIKRTKKDITHKYLSELTWDQLQKLKELYQLDLSLFNYSFNVKTEISF